MKYKWKIVRRGRLKQVELRSGADIAALNELDCKEWFAMSCPVGGVRIDQRMLELMDTDCDGRVRMGEVLAAIEFLKTRGVDLDSLFEPNPKLPLELVAAKNEDEERVIRYKAHLREFLENFVNMRRLYDGASGSAIFQTGILRIDGRELHLCFHVDDEATHSQLAAMSKCCLLYVKLSRPAEEAERTIAAVVTRGRVGTLYVGRRGVFVDRDGKDWEAVISSVVEAQVSLVEAFWAPWRKVANGITGAVKKFLLDKEAKEAKASTVAALGIGIGMAGAAFASLVAVISRMTAWQLVGVVVATVLVVSLPSVVLAYFKLRQRDLGAILNASGWAVNRSMYLSVAAARNFTPAAKLT